MAEGTVPVDLRNPGQVFACLGLMEAAEILLGPCEAGFDYTDDETLTRFTLTAPGATEPIRAIIDFLAHAKAVAFAPEGWSSQNQKWDVYTETTRDGFPGQRPDSSTTLPIVLRANGAEIPIDHWIDGDEVGRDNFKLWAGVGGYPGAAFARDALVALAGLDPVRLLERDHAPFGMSAPMTSSFRLDMRRDYIAIDAGFSPNLHRTMTMVGYPLVEILAAIGLQNARPVRVHPRNKLIYRYGLSNFRLPTRLARVVLGGQDMGFPIRLFRMRLDWPGKEGQARCIVDAQEELL